MVRGISNRGTEGLFPHGAKETFRRSRFSLEYFHFSIIVGRKTPVHVRGIVT
ncbi:hypothetical protein O8B39_02775 [Agrobacterium rhizogenes]|nr:hypothetical protein [Rhizobium rhizogenes]